MKTGRCVRCPRANGPPLLGSRLTARIAEAGGGFERPNPLIAGGPDPNAVIRIRDRLTSHADAPAPEARWCVSPNVHHQRIFVPRMAEVDA
jgi:hypothetical protein